MSTEDRREVTRQTTLSRDWWGRWDREQTAFKNRQKNEFKMENPLVLALKDARCADEHLRLGSEALDPRRGRPTQCKTPTHPAAFALTKSAGFRP